MVGDSCSIMSNDYELTMDYDMLVSIGKSWIQLIDMIVLIFGTCGWREREVTGSILVLAWQGNSWYVYITNSSVMWQCIVSLEL